MPPLAVLFVCVHNAGRSQAAATIFNARAAGRWRAESGGTRPAGHIHPEVAAVLAERGYDSSGTVPRLMTPELVAAAGLVVGMGCNLEDACPAYKSEDWGLADPKGQPPERVREIIDEIEVRVDELLGRLARGAVPARG